MLPITLRNQRLFFRSRALRNEQRTQAYIKNREGLQFAAIPLCRPLIR
ncbi:hypothetical protein HMPREF1588_05661 [Escherichia coli 110957]|nr:hypothetical protein HMPREF1588_05661 [Escherichia coli 110957]